MPALIPTPVPTPDLHIEPAARAALERVIAAHPGRVLRVRHEGYG